MSLLQLQSDFRSFLVEQDLSAIVDYVDQDGLIQQRLNIYRNNHVYSLIESLGDLYPVCKRLVGDNFFNGCATEFVRAHPPKSAAMVSFGGDFPEFLESFEPAKQLGFLPDVARLELAWHSAYHAIDRLPFSAETLGSIPEQDVADLILALHPSARLLDSAFPIASIWSANQPDQNGEIKVSIETAEQVLVCRPEFEVQVVTIDSPALYFLSLVQQGKPLGVAMAQALENYPNWDAGQAFGFFIQLGVFAKGEVEPD